MHRRTLLGGAASLPFLSILSSSAFAHPPRQPDAAESQSLAREIRRLRERMTAAAATKDIATLRLQFSDRYTHVDETGRLLDKAARLADLEAGRPLVETMPATELSFQVFTGPTVIVTGRSTLPPDAAAAATDGKPRDLRWTAVYVTARDGWQVAGSQSTRVGESR